MELHRAVLLRRSPDVEARRQPEDRTALELDRGHDEVRAADPERRPVQGDPVGTELPAPGADGSRRTDHGRRERQRIDRDVDHGPDVVERRRRRMPGLDPAPADVGIDRADGAEPIVADPRGGGLLRLPEDRRRRAAQAQPSRHGKVDELARLARAERQWLLAVDVTTRLQRTTGHLVVRVMDGQVDDDVDGRVAQQVLDGGVGTAAMLLGERVQPGRIEIRGRHQVDLRMGEDVARVAAGDVAGAHDADAEWFHRRSLRDCRMVSSCDSTRSRSSCTRSGRSPRPTWPARSGPLPPPAIDRSSWRVFPTPRRTSSRDS